MYAPATEDAHGRAQDVGRRPWPATSSRYALSEEKAHAGHVHNPAIARRPSAVLCPEGLVPSLADLYGSAVRQLRGTLCLSSPSRAVDSRGSGPLRVGHMVVAGILLWARRSLSVLCTSLREKQGVLDVVEIHGRRRVHELEDIGGL